MPYELKHTYKNFHSDSSIDFKGTPTTIGYEPNYPIQGVGNDNRIGLKFTSSSFVIDFLLTIPSQAYPFIPEVESANLIKSCGGSINTGTGVISSTTDSVLTFKPALEWFANFRFFVVRCDPTYVFRASGSTSTTDNYVHWFLKEFAYIYKDGSDVEHYTNQMSLLRESTEDTGQFSILYDKQFKLSNKKDMYHFNKSFKYVTKFNFKEPTSLAPSNYTYHFFIIPPLASEDYSTSLQQHTGDIPVTWQGVIKMNYTDF